MSSTTLLVALITAFGTGAPALAYAIYRGRKLTPFEQDEISTRAAHQAVESMQVSLGVAIEERKRYARRIETLEEEAEARARDIENLRVELRSRDELIGDLRRQVHDLEGRVA